MPLHFDLASLEKIYVGRSVMMNTSTARMKLVIEGDSPVLRAKDIVVPDEDSSPLIKLYACLQYAYLYEDLEKRRGQYLKSFTAVLSTSPELIQEIAEIDRVVTAGDLYRALRLLKKMLPVEAFVFRRPNPLLGTTCAAA